ncbi:beta-ketoacyl synthase [Halobacteriovorax sp. HLS]|uniref:beta-ketoacyl-[acyl-carrier-protein] synthase family protein n=1 Tax=Halobacteriovorax sp. HLS TaxID=2234000 RepID=UPI000FD8B8A5|nr:beta-ketoacyl-[acyl-carrier-protein] synthase family protein [Halobacteriovorax sp. HLS]
MKCYITGMGAISPMGKSVDEMFDKYLEGYCPIETIDEFKNFYGVKSHIGSIVKDLDIKSIDRKIRRTSSKMTHMSILAMKEALDQAGLDSDILNSNRSLLCTGSTTGSPTEYYDSHKKIIENESAKGQKSTSVFKCMSHTNSTNMAISINFTGAVLSANSACASGNQSVVLASQLIKAGIYDVAIVGGCEEAHKTTVSTFDAAHASSINYNDSPKDSSRPFDKNRDGVVISEGAGIIILESEEFAKKRGATLLAEVVGGDYSGSGVHMAQSDTLSITNNIKRTLINTNTNPLEVDFISAHATSTRQGDNAESWGIFNAFERDVSVHSLKGYTGHTFAASGAIETAMLVKMMNTNMIIPNHNLSEVDPELPNLNFVNTQSKNRELKTVLNFNSGFGGINSSFIMKKVGSDESN